MDGDSIDDFVKLSREYNIPVDDLTLQYYFKYRELNKVLSEQSH